MTDQNTNQNDPLLEKLKQVQKETEEKENQEKKEIGNKEMEKVLQELEEVKKLNDMLTETSKRALADLQNYKKRSEEEKKVFVQYANANLILEILTTLDNFERAFKNIPEDLKNTDFIKGIIHIEKGLYTTLEKAGVKPIKALGEHLDTNLHETLMEGPGEKDVVIEEFEKGYTLGDKILRPAKVKEGNGK